MRITQSVGRYAENPYTIPQNHLRIWSVEELCYYMCENVHVLEPDLVDRELIRWIDEECELGELAEELQRLCGPVLAGRNLTEQMRQTCLCRFVTAILDYVCYISHERVQDLERYLKENSNAGDFERNMLRAAYGIRDGRYHQAFEIYMKLLDTDEGRNEEHQAKICHNLGVLFAYKSDFAQAAQMFGKAYRLSGSLESMRQYLAAQRMHLGQQGFLVFIGEHPELYADSVVVTEELEELEKNFKESEEYARMRELRQLKESRTGAEYYKRINDLSTEWKDEYRAAFSEG